jgi:hypothetical protein
MRDKKCYIDKKNVFHKLMKLYCTTFCGLAVYCLTVVFIYSFGLFLRLGVVQSVS